MTLSVGSDGYLSIVLSVAEQVGELQADTIDDGNDGERDAGCNQAVFDRRSSEFVTQELRKKTLHYFLSALDGPLRAGKLPIKT